MIDDPEPPTEDDIFCGAVVLYEPPLADRYDYKKSSGSSDAYTTEDTIET